MANAKGERFKNYVRRYGMQVGARVKFDVDFEENRGRPYANNWAPQQCLRPLFPIGNSSETWFF